MASVSVPASKESAEKRDNAMLFVVPIVGIAVALLLLALSIRFWLNMDNNTTVTMVRPLAISAIVSIAVALVLYWFGLYYSRSIRFTFLFTTVIVASLTLTNGLIAANSMFVDRVILIETAILLAFSTILAAAFSIGAFVRMASGLNSLSNSAKNVANGKYATRVDVGGRDELAELGLAFNDMASELEDAARQRDELERLRRDLIAWVSHDLRTPLTSIRAMVEALNDGLVTEEAQVNRYHKSMLTDIMGLNRLIDDLFELAQLDAGGLTFNLEKDSLGDLISDTLEGFGGLAAQRGVALQGNISGNLDPVMMSSSKIGRVLSNLVSNALKYTPEGGTVTVNAERQADEISVSVCDSGSGFVAADIPYVFEKFYRGEGARSRLHGSSAGLGLSIARGIIDGHGGRIWAENGPNGGAVVSFVLPQ